MTQTATLDPPDFAIDLFDVFANCLPCGSPGSQLLFVHKECGTVVRCTRCKLRFIRSRWIPSMPELPEQKPESLPDMILQKQDSQTDDFLDIRNRIKRYQANGKLLELGCCTGSRSRARLGFEGSGLSRIRGQWSMRVASSV